LSAFGTLPDDLPPKQPFWDRPGILADVAQVKSSLRTPAQLASFLAASSPHSGDWLQAMPVSSCGLRLDDEAVRIGVGLRLGLTLCVPHKCHCGALVDAQAKYCKFHIIETTASILTKFGIMIETTKWSSWVIPVSAQQIQDGGRPPF